MTSAEQIDEWIKEVQERPSSAPVILEYISKRLFTLIQRNEDLLTENIELRSGRRVEEYEQRIANLEYQLEMLKRQLGGENLNLTLNAKVDWVSLIIFNHQGKVIRANLEIESIRSGTVHPVLTQAFHDNEVPPRMLVTAPTEELLFVFDSGRTEALAAETIPVQELTSLNWENAWLVEPRGGEELSAVLPLAKMTLYDLSAQVSRRGCARKMLLSSFENHLQKKFIGTGIKQRPDRTCAVLLANKEDRLVVVSREGFLLALNFEQLGFTAEEVIRLAVTDHIFTAFRVGKQSAVAVVTNTGKIIQREVGWLDPVDSFRSKGQPLFSQARRDAGIRCAGAAAVDEKDWGAFLLSSGAVWIGQMGELFRAGALSGMDEQTSVVDFWAFSLPE